MSYASRARAAVPVVSVSPSTSANASSEGNNCSIRTAATTAAAVGTSQPACLTHPAPASCAKQENILSPACYFFVDNSYVFIEGQKWLAQQQRSPSSSRDLPPTDRRFRINTDALTVALAAGRTIGAKYVFGSLQAEGETEDRAVTVFRQQQNNTTHIRRRGKTSGMEKRVDGMLVSAVVRVAMQLGAAGGCLVVVSGDRDMLAACYAALERSQCSLEVYGLSSSISSHIRRLQTAYPHRVSVGTLNATFAAAITRDSPAAPCFIAHGYVPAAHHHHSSVLIK